MGYPTCLKGYLDPYPVLFHGVSVSIRLQYDTYVTHSRQPAAQTQPAVVGASGGEIQDEIPQDVCVYGELEELVV